MSIQDTFSFDKDGQVIWFSWLRRFFLAFVIILVGLLSFGLGRLSAPAKSAGVGEIQITQGSPALSASAVSAGLIVASSAGTKYYYPGCSNNITEKNKITFANSADAETAGYTLAANCQKP